ncbi:MAG: hypothetical protein LBC70_08635 [Chitinispirillales bacterium]|jgi:hypothetical protein|nr:hypothetical protein [Chitinispirillales bacterium]
MDTETIKTPLPIGESFFDLMIENGYYYMDKTFMPTNGKTRATPTP